MFELIRAGERTWYIEGPAKVGVYLASENKVWLIDSGNDKDAGRKIMKLLDARGWQLQGILNTHSNADHSGGNAFIQRKTQCPLLATGIENAFLRYPILEPSFLYGAFPPKALRNKFLMAQPSEPAGEVDRHLPEGIRMIPLDGHFFGMAGYGAPDGVWFLGDCLFGPAILEKYHLFFIYDVAAFLKTLDDLEKLEGTLFIPSHAEVCRDLKPLIELNRAKITEILEKLTELCGSGRMFEDILRDLFLHYGLVMDFNQYVLCGSTVRSCLAYLSDAGTIEARFEDCRLLWSRKGV